MATSTPNCMDGEIAAGNATSRAAVMLRALQRDQRRQEAEHDARIYAADPANEFDDLTAWASRRPLDIDTTTIRGLHTELPVGLLLGYLLPAQESALTRAIMAAFALEHS